MQIIKGSYEEILLNAQTLYNQDDLEGAAKEYRRLVDRLSSIKPELLRRRPTLIELILISGAELGKMLTLLSRYDEALALFDHLLESAPAGEPLWRRNRALVNLTMGDVAAGLDILRALAVIHPGAGSWRMLGACCFWTGNYREAEESLQRVLDLGEEAENDESFLSAWLLFDVYRETGRIEEALTAWERISPYKDGSRGYWTPPVRMLLCAGDLERAEKCVEREEDELGRGCLRGLLAQARGDQEGARRHWQRVYESSLAGHEESVEFWAEAALRLGHPKEAGEVLRRSFPVGKRTALTYLLLAISEANQGLADAALKELERAGKKALTISYQSLLSASDWRFLDGLVGDAAFKEQARPFFAQEGGRVPGFRAA